MTWFGRAARRIGSPDAISWPAFWVTLAAGLVGNAVTSAEVPLGARLLALGLGQIALWLPLAAVGIALRRRPDRPRPLLVLTAAVAGLMVRALIVGVVLGALVGQDAVEWTDRFVGALFNIGLSFLVCAYIVSAVRERRRHIADLQATEQRLAAAVADLGREFVQRNEEVADEVRSALLAELNALDPTDARRSLDALQRTATEVVRPLSHELATTRPDDDLPSLPQTDVVVSWRQVLDGAATGAPFRPGLTAAIFSVEGMAAAVAYPPGTWIFVVLCLALWGLLILANGTLRIALLGRPRILRMSLVLMCAIVVGAVMALIVFAGLSGAPPVEELTFATFVFAVGFSLGVGVAASFARDRDRIVRELEESSLALTRRLVRWRQAQWFQQKALSRALHGPIQTAVTAAALRLDSSIRSGGSDPGLVEQVRRDLRVAMGGLSALDADVASLSEVGDRLAATWEGLCDVALLTAPGVDEVVDSDAVLRSSLIDLITEAVSNAVRHGGATHVNVVIESSPRGPVDLLLTVDSDSRRRGAQGQRGLGTQLLDECTLWWDLEDSNLGMRLSAALPVDL